MKRLKRFLNLVRSIGLVKQTPLPTPENKQAANDKTFADACSSKKQSLTRIPQKH